FKPDGTVTGHWCREQATGREPILPMKAEPVAEPDPSRRFALLAEEGDADPSADVAGTWRMEFDRYGIAKGVFQEQAPGVLTGTIEVPSEYGDLRFLAGNVRGARLQLSTFDGQHAFLLEGELQTDGVMEGAWVNHLVRAPFVARRDDDFEVPDPLERVAFVPDEQRLELEPLHDSIFDGKPVIVEIFGTWCPNCNDHAPVLVDLHRKYRSEGLEILGLAYEYGEDLEYKQRRVREFKKKHGIEWEIVITDATLEDLASEGLAGLSPIEGVPVTIFLNRDRTVHAVYSGFSGPATGEAHSKAKAELEKLTAEILEGL
ncbi:MAG TPA: TlpA disulfide reductase family protein, partial [Vicinamibacteria bacterium]|nr:TlpA disulfide reductase family protein [Vicinamibacteria bacterium]